MVHKMKLTGCVYAGVADMVRAATDDECANDFEQRLAQTRLVNQLVLLRVTNGLTQKDLAERLGRSQAWVSKIEHSRDESIGLGDLARYANALGFGTRVALSSQELGTVGSVRFPAREIEKLATELKGLAEKVPEIAQVVSRFFGEATFDQPRHFEEGADKSVDSSRLDRQGFGLVVEPLDADVVKPKTRKRVYRPRKPKASA